jgi:phosphate transport system substrate-binding protein
MAMKDFQILALATAAAALAPLALRADAVKVDPAVPPYQTTSGVSGSVKSIGSDTMNNTMTLWGESFRKLYPNIKIEIEGKGSGTAPPALTAGTSQFGPMSRPMKDAETDAFEKKYGYPPTQVRTSLDAVAIYVNKDNPIECLTLQQVDAIFSKSRRGGAAKDAKTWGDLGVKGDLASKPISLYGRNSSSGTYGYFKEHALFNGDYKDTVKEQPGSSSVVQGVASDKGGIGYAGMGYKTADVRTVPLAARQGDQCHPADEENVYDGEYPLWRYLLIYVNRKPGEPLDPLREQFLKFVLSREGQEAVVKNGDLPLPKKTIDEEIAKLK